MQYPQSETYTTPSRTLVVPTGNLERALHEYNDFNLADANHEDTKNFLLLHQKDWDILFLDAYADIESKYDAIAIQVTRAFMEVLNQKLPIEQGQLTHTQDIQVGLHKIAKLLIPKAAEGEPSLEKLQRFYATGEKLTSHKKEWNSTIDHLDQTLSAYGVVLLQRLLRKTQGRIVENIDNKLSTQDILFAPPSEQLH